LGGLGYLFGVMSLAGCPPLEEVAVGRRRICPDNLYVFYPSFCLDTKGPKGQVKV